MNKRAIWVIIGLMSAALIGTIILQGYWINWSYQLSENQFSKDVFAVLNRVVDKLESLERREELEVYSMANDPTYRIDPNKDILPTEASQSLEASLPQNYSDGNGGLKKEGNVSHPKSDEEEHQDYLEQTKIRERMEMSKWWNPEPVTERIDLQVLDAAIKKELKNRNISLDYTYGVFSKKEKSFVINDGHYVVTDPNPQAFTGGWKNLYNSDYKVDLYPNDMKPTGMLMIHFPGKVGLFWGSLWKTVLSSIIFTGLILFCFAYTVQVIFFQKKVSEMKTDFINNMTHEFKTPIATISLAADSITSPMISGNVDKVKRFANIIKQENKRMNNQVEKVLQMAVIDKQEFSLKLMEINIHEVINQAVGNISLQVEKKEGVVRAFLKAKNPVIQGDMTHVTNMIHNLLDNANKYSPDKPEIAVHTTDVPKGVQVIIEDKGMGMTKEAKKHIFDKFYRVHTGNRHDVKGFGLGLSYVKAMITAHNGQIEVKSELGSGSKFILTFPHKVAKS